MNSGLVKRKKKKFSVHHWEKFGTIAPVTIWMGIFFALPLTLILVTSFMTRGTYGDIEATFTIQNYVRFFDPLYIQIVWKSVLMSLYTTVICLLLGYPFAYIVSQAHPKYRNILLMLIIVPFWTNSLVRTYAWILLLRTEGVINTFLLQLGLITEPLTLLYNEGATLVGLVYTLLPFMILPLYASLEKMDPVYLEAAKDLGANPWQSFLRITFPMSLPGVIAGSLLVFIPTLGLFFIPDLLGGGKVMLIGNFIQNQFLTTRDWPFGSAASIILMTCTLLFIALYIKLAGGKKETEVYLK